MKEAPISADGLREKIARLVQERGWNQHEFARLAGVSRLTVRSIFQAEFPAATQCHGGEMCQGARDERL